MSELIVRFTCAVSFLMLSACCDFNENDCPPEVRAQRQANRDYWDEKAKTPELISQTDGIRLYRIWTFEPSYKLQNHWTYFTTPCGDVNAELTWEEATGTLKTRHYEKHHQQIRTSGSACK